jgi:hypothetical protein
VSKGGLRQQLLFYSQRKMQQDATMYKNFIIPLPDNVHQLHVQQPSTYEKPEAASAVLGS